MKLAASCHILAVVTVLGTAFVAQPASACGTDAQRVDDVEFAQPPDPVSQLLQEATRLEARARQMDQSAAALDRAAENLAVRAREIRNLAFAQGDLDRARLLAQSSQLSAQAAVSRASAQERRADAEQLRVSARETRNRAARLAGGNPRPRPRPWRGGLAQTI
jgi:hypothetical protein